jgi:adenylate cyclase
MSRVNRLYRRLLPLAGISVIALVLALDALGVLRGLDYSSIDARFAIRGSEGPSPALVVVPIDSDTISYLSVHDRKDSRFPFPRALDAKVITNLARDGAKVIFVDLQYTEPTDIADDNALIEATRAAGNVVLSTTEVGPGGRTNVFGGGQGLAISRATPAEAQFPVGSDGRIRRVTPQLRGLTTVAFAVVSRARGHAIRSPGGARGSMLIDYRGPAGTMATVSYWRVLEDRFRPGTFRGKIVLVGHAEPNLSSPTITDVHATPTSNHMSGVEVQANAIDTVLRGFPLADGPGWVSGALIVLLALTAPLIALWRSALLAAGVTLLEMVLLAVGCQLAFNSGTVIGFVYPVAAGVLSSGTTLGLRGLHAAISRELTRETFARFVPESVVSEVLAAADGARLGGVRVEVTVLFSDLRGFTTFSEQREPDETIAILNRYLTEMTDAILEFGGTLVSYMGDGIMAVFGAPIEQPDHADRALAAARAMLAHLEVFNAWLTSDGATEGFKMGIGLNTGPVMAGNVGSERRLEYTTIGDTTNTASRLEGMTKGTPHQLYLAASTVQALAEVPDDLVQVAEMEVRGREGRVTVWALELPDGSTPGAPDGSTAAQPG